ncbi:MAG TPA: FG-GAP-like repeat-containing protein [Candidatus Acidoferrum sp.]|nr:FG-GAP-like repeat-containing protein [Candidatus Acidoferrum sp.]
MRTSRLAFAIFFLASVFSSVANSANNPVPFVQQRIVPTSAAPGGAAFTLTVNGTGFVSGATVEWNGSARTTTFVSGSQLTATIPSTDITTAGTAMINVLNPAPGGGISNTVFFEVSAPTTAVTYGVLNGYGANGAPAAGTRQFAIADLNGDGKRDVATLNGDGSISVLLGNNDGTFAAPLLLQPAVQPNISTPLGLIGSVTTNAVGIVAVDFNGDGKLDVAEFLTVVGATSGQGSAVVVFLGNGDGTFASPVVSTSTAFANSLPQFLLAADVNGDGKLDLLTPCGNPAGSVCFWSGHRDGSFTAASSNAVAPSNVALSGAPALGDFNGDGKLDLILTFTTTSGDETAAIALGAGDGTFGTPTTIDTFPGFANNQTAVAAADFDEDGKLDVAFYYQNCAAQTGPCSGAVDLLSGAGDGTFLAPLTIANLEAPAQSLLTADANEDGHMDLFFAHTVLLGRGDGTFTVNSATLPKTVAAAADFNGDGFLDVLTADPQGFFLSTRTTPDFSGFSSPTSQTVNAGANTSYTVSISPLYGSEYDVALSLAGLPTGATATFAPPTVAAANGSTLLSVNTTSSTTPGTYSLTLTGTATNSVTHSAPITLVVNPASADFAGDIAPGGQLIAAGQTAGFVVSVSPINGFTGDVTLSATGAPTGSVVSFNPPVIAGGSGISVLSITPPANAPSGLSILTISGTSGSLSHSGKRELNVNNSADFSGFISPTINSVIAGQRVNYTVNVTSLNGYTGATTLSLSGLPANTAFRFTPTTLMGGAGTSSLIITTSASTPTGSYTLTLSGQSGSDVKSTTIQLNVNASAGDFGGSITPTSQSVNAGTSATYSASITPSGGFTGSVTLTVSNLPAGATVSFSPSNVITGGSGSASFTISTTGVAPGTYSVLVTGVSGGITHSGSVTLTVN